MRTIAFGDIHGCAKALQALLDTIQPMEQDRLIFLGDYIDRGPDTKGVIEQLLELKGRCEALFLLGNHEIVFRAVLNGLPADRWLEIGGKQTLDSYGGQLSNVPQSHIDFLLNLRPYFETDDAIFVHANYDANLPLALQSEDMLFWRHLGDSFPTPHTSGKHVFLGHTPQAGGEVGYFGHFTGLDTCCFAGGWLTAMDTASGQLWQASLSGEIRKNEKFLQVFWRKLNALGGGLTART